MWLNQQDPTYVCQMIISVDNWYFLPVLYSMIWTPLLSATNFLLFNIGTRTITWPGIQIFISLNFDILVKKDKKAVPFREALYNSNGSFDYF